MSTKSLCMIAATAFAPVCAQAAPPANLLFSRGDWELACDNTRTCRAAGYHRDDDQDMAVSVLLTRKAGPNQAVTGELQIGQYGENETLKKLPSEFDLSMRINERSIGRITVRKESLIAHLPANQVAALLTALPRESNIDWVTGESRWRLSDKGAAAVFLKMDEFQGRIGTKGALLSKGSQNEDAVLLRLPVPAVMAAPLTKPLPEDDQFAKKHSSALWKALAATVNNDDCSMLKEGKADETKLTITRLTDTKLLVSTPCWGAAYNFGAGYWVVDQTPPYHPVLVTASGSDYGGSGRISASHKGRGLGDCYSLDSWTWDGKKFIHTEASSTGMCKLMAPGGAWTLPTITTDVRPASR